MSGIVLYMIMVISFVLSDIVTFVTANFVTVQVTMRLSAADFIVDSGKQMLVRAADGPDRVEGCSTYLHHQAACRNVLTKKMSLR